MKKIILILTFVFTTQIVFGQKYDEAWGLSEGMGVVKLNGKYGFVNEQGQEIVAPKYDDVGNFSEGFAYVIIDKKRGYVNKKGELAIPIKYDKAMSFKQGVAVVKLNGKSGLINTKGQEITLLKYDEIYAFSVEESLAPFKLDNKYGYINRNGEEVIPAKYEMVYAFSEGAGLVKLNQKWGCIDTKGKEITPVKYDMAYNFSEGLGLVKLNQKWGFINTKGKEVIPIEFVEAGAFHDGFAKVKSFYEYGVRWTFIDKKGKQINEYFQEADSYSAGGLKGLAKVRSQKTGKLGLRDVNGKYVVPCEYNTIMMNKENTSWKIDNGFALIIKMVGNSDRFGIVNSTGIFVPCVYNSIGDVTTAYPIVVEKEDKYGFIDHTGKEILPIECDYATNFNEDKEGLAYVDKDGKSFYIDENGKFAEEASEDVKEKYTTLKNKIIAYRESKNNPVRTEENNNSNSNNNKTSNNSSANNNKKTPDKCTYKCQKCNKITQGKCNSSANGIAVENCFVQQPDPKKGRKNHEWRKQ